MNLKNIKEVRLMNTSCKNSEEYILLKLENLSKANEILVESIVKELGEWAKPIDVAKYFNRGKRSIYELIENEEVIARRMGNGLRIYSKSLILVLERV